MMEGNQDLDAVTRDICVEGAVWSLGARNNPLHLKRSDLNPVARGWHEFIINNIMPTTNQSEVTLNRAVLIHCIMSSQEVRVEKIIVDAMMNIINKLHTSKPPLAFPNIITRLCEEMEISFLASGPVEAIPKARSITPVVIENIRHPPVQTFNPQQHFHHKQPADGYGWGQLQEDMANITIRENFKAGRPLFHGMLRPWPPEGSSNAPGQQATPAVDVPRDPKANSDDEN
ncbi:hypothetical protein PIB30_097854 [Stylosanthes scabra]|uniref:Putative plant transposon protein domain-containing protein n=1 Tax=Stylosanthes scabra TaxID=79078 RepID=A0ABU6TYH7_9FABA|nr:hypothetical protein [Stylosanthes scabra]